MKPALQALLGPIKDNMGIVNDSLSGNLGSAIRSGMEDLTRPVVTDLVNQISDAAQNAEGALSVGEQANIEALITAEMNGLEGVLVTELSAGTGPIIGRIDQILAGLENLVDKIETLDPTQLAFSWLDCLRGPRD